MVMILSTLSRRGVTTAMKSLACTEGDMAEPAAEVVARTLDVGVGLEEAGAEAELKTWRVLALRRELLVWRPTSTGRGRRGPGTERQSLEGVKTNGTRTDTEAMATIMSPRTIILVICRLRPMRPTTIIKHILAAITSLRHPLMIMSMIKLLLHSNRTRILPTTLQTMPRADLNTSHIPIPMVPTTAKPT